MGGVDQTSNEHRRPQRESADGDPQRCGPTRTRSVLIFTKTPHPIAFVRAAAAPGRVRLRAVAARNVPPLFVERVGLRLEQERQAKTDGSEAKPAEHHRVHHGLVTLRGLHLSRFLSNCGPAHREHGQSNGGDGRRTTNHHDVPPGPLSGTTTQSCAHSARTPSKTKGGARRRASRPFAERVAAFDLRARRGGAADRTARAGWIAAAALGDVAATRDHRRTLRRRHEASGRTVAVCRCRPGGAARPRLAALGVAALAVEADLTRGARLPSARERSVGRRVGAVAFLRHAPDEQASEEQRGSSKANDDGHAGHLGAEARARRAHRAAGSSNARHRSGPRTTRRGRSSKRWSKKRT